MGGRRRTNEAPPPGEAIAQRRLRAVEEVLDVRRLESTPYPHLEVRNPVHRTRYLVLFPLYPDEEPAFCTCSDFARRGLGTCKHIEAAFRWLRLPENAGAPEEGAVPAKPIESDRIWAEIDRRRARLPAEGPKDIRVLARPGAVLFETRNEEGRSG
jgi:hypothetical protein